MARSRKMLDLCCGGGLAAAGYWLSGCFSEIVGVDVLDMTGRYPFDFIQGDAFALDYEFLSQFDFIHASPPCQAYSTLTPQYARARHKRLIPAAHLMLKAALKPHVIENVGGSTLDLRPNLRLSGFDVGLPMQRYRYFHIDECFPGRLESEYQATRSYEGPAWSLSEDCDRNLDKSQRCDLDKSQRRSLSDWAGPVINIHRGGAYVSRQDLIKAFGLEEISPHHLARLSTDDMKQGIPPRMTKKIARDLFDRVMLGERQ